MILSLNGIIAGRGVIPSTLLNSLVSVYKAESNANDSLGTYNGTAQGGLTYVSGKSGNAFKHNGTDAYVSLPNNTFNSFTGDFSISGWMNLARVDVNQAICGAFNNNADTNYYGWLFWCAGNLLRFTIYNGTNSGISLDTSGVGGGNLSASTWIHFAMTRKGSTGTKLYLNGSFKTSNTSTQNPVYHSTTNYCTIGTYKYYAAPNFLFSNNSLIDEIEFRNKELSASEITELYNAGAGKYYPTY